ncbi:hypothetical protein HDF26_004454 [Pedobacter cryoconitis]|uniref:polysaccharide lyase n=1 Tax=Pedobacter cryoconitis TaxID=188932 RepID=UPI00162127E6|nr:hypothetical protein [Pedobacter cryoconitis]MBB6273981.1 hypothetical protein [Pedobacter cryoconitis]
MRKNTNNRQLMAAMLLLAVLFGTSCKKDVNQQSAGTPDKETSKTEVSAVNSSLNLNWENRTNGSTYTNSQASADFGNVSGWQDSRAYITNGKDANGLRITLLPNALSAAGGMVSNTNLNQGSAYELDFDVKFHSNFNFGRGGKIGFGFAIGEGNTGGDPGWDGNGGTLRLMWYSPSADRVFFQPYVYHKDQPTKFGDTYTKRFPASGSLQKGVWYHVHMYVKSNTGSNTNGRAQIIIDGTTILDNDIRWTTNDSQRLINKLTFHTFRGGSQDEWKTNTTDYIYYDNLKVNKIN